MIYYTLTSSLKEKEIMEENEREINEKALKIEYEKNQTNFPLLPFPFLTLLNVEQTALCR